MGEYRKLARQPLVFALAEFRFSQVLQIEEYIPEYQELLRKSYPLTETLQEHAIKVGDKSVDLRQRSRWAFLSADRRNVVTLDQDRLIFFTTDYPRFEGFASECLNALELFVKLVEPELLLRIGLRYGDLIKIGDGEKLGDYVDPYFDYPKLAIPLGTPEYQRDEVGIRTDVGRLLIRSIYGDSNLVSLPDIQGIPGLPQPEKSSSNRIILDFDHVWSADEEPTRFDIGHIEKTLAKMHETARDAFWRITTDDAKDNKWN